MNKNLFIISLLIYAWWPVTAYAQSPVILTDEQGKYTLGLHLAYLADPSGQLTINEVISPQYAHQFIPSQEETLGFGYTKSAYWVRFLVRNDSHHDWLLRVGFPNMNHVDLYLPATGLHKVSGNHLPFSAREVANQNIVFKLPLSPTQTSEVSKNSEVSQTSKTSEVYLRFENEASMTLGLTMWTDEAFAMFCHSESLFLGALYGIIMVMVLYNLFIYLFLWEKEYLYYAVSLIAIVIHRASVNGLTQQYLWPNHQWNSYIIPIFSATFELGIGAFCCANS